MKKKNVIGIILAAGMGRRMMSDITKQQMDINGKSVLRRCLESFFLSKYINELIIVVRDTEREFVVGELEQMTTKPYRIVTGGNTRAESAYNGFKASHGADYIAIHDAARCMITAEMIDSVIVAAFEYDAASAVCAVNDTVKRVEDGMISGTVPRNSLVMAQTPQVFKADIYRKSLEMKEQSDTMITDDNMLVEKMGVKIKCVDLGSTNIKVTTPDDLVIASAIARIRGEYV